MRDAKFGIYTHWGVYSVPAYNNEHYYRTMHHSTGYSKHGTYQRHVALYGPLKEFGYHDFIPMFKAEHFDPEDWADLFHKAGAKFAGPVAQHHDGFAMWASQVNHWNAGDKGPERDILGELFHSLEERKLKTIATFHHARNGQRNADNPENWYTGYNSHYPYDPDFPTSTSDPVLAKLYGNIPIEEFNQYWLNQIVEVVDIYSPDIIWFDSWLNLIPDEYRRKMVAHYLNDAEAKGKEVVLANKQADLPFSVGVLDYEQGGRKEINQAVWMTDITISLRSWSYIKGQEYKDASLVIRNMIDVWSKNGVVLLNISPRADGIIPDEQRKVLEEIGEWLGKYGEAVYGTRPHIIHGTGSAIAEDGRHGGQSATVQYSASDIRYTVSKDGKTFYLFFLGKPEAGQRITLRQLGMHRYPTPAPIKRITLLGTDIEAEGEMTTNNFYLTIPEAQMDEIATVFKFELE
jgi:alpha-L-fucosidase